MTELSASSHILTALRGDTQYLAICHCTNHVIVRWETNATGFVLESSGSIPSESWSSVSLPVTATGRHFYVDHGVATDRAQFYRLRGTNGVGR